MKTRQCTVYKKLKVQPTTRKPLNRNDADDLTVNMMQSNRMLWLLEDIHKALLNYLTFRDDEQKMRLLRNYIKYIEGMKEEFKKDFLGFKKEILDNMC